MANLSALYDFRFKESERPQKLLIWKTLCESFFQKLVGEGKTILDLASGYGEFSQNIRAKRKIAVDLNPDAKAFLPEGTEFHNCSATAITGVESNSVDVIFTSNFLEHLRTKEELDRVFQEMKRVLRPGGRFIIMGPNIRYVYAEYWDFYDHYLPLSHLSLEEGLVQAGYEIERLIPRFLPYSTRSSLPKATFLIRAYLAFPPAWQILGKQFLCVARKPAGPSR
jgi:SAM-dependent methyltransferase